MTQGNVRKNLLKFRKFLENLWISAGGDHLEPDVAKGIQQNNRAGWDGYAVLKIQLVILFVAILVLVLIAVVIIVSVMIVFVI